MWSSIKRNRMVAKEGHHLKTHHGIGQVRSLQELFSEVMGILILGLTLMRGNASG